MTDPRLEIIDKRLRNIKKIIAVSGGKGGVGKSSVSSMLSLVLTEKDYSVGLLDMDFYGPSCHILLGADINKFPEENKGIIPPVVSGIKFMSIAYYGKDNPAVFRGVDITNSIIELLSVVIWGNLDFLIIDMPPGIGEATLDSVNLIKRVSFLLVTIPSLLAFDVMKKTAGMLGEFKIPVIGALENMIKPDSVSFKENIEKIGISYQGKIEMDKIFEQLTGNVKKLQKTFFVKDLRQIIFDNKNFNI